MDERIAVEDEAGERIDKFLSDELSDRSRSFLQKLIKEQYVKVNDKPVKASYRLNFGDLVSITFPEPEKPNIAAENIPLDILYEDQDLIIINKPKQMVVHPAPGHYTGTLVNALLYHCQDNLSGINEACGPGLYIGSIWIRRALLWYVKMMRHISLFLHN